MTRTARTIGIRLTLAAGLASMVAGAWLLGADLVAAQRYRALSDQLTSAPQHETSARVDWDALRSLNADAIAWLRVEGTSIDHPVLAAPDADPSFYLGHNLWRQPSRDGCPFLDHRCAPTGAHLVVYAHHVSGTRIMFSELFDCHQQGRFDELGALLWETPHADLLRMAPLCALSRPSDWDDIQRFSFGDAGDLRAWLTDLCDQATARSPGHAARIARTSRAITLVTCSSPLPGQDARTLVVFVAP